ncbi:MAG: hypothetical protein MK180_04600 [Rhodobacteraceae bacterium]|nr:hypothetical protein [Paracoccaceae bacterium]
MIFTDRFLFLHYPKTAGKSLSAAVVQSWGGLVTAYISPGQMCELAGYVARGSTLYVEGAHQNAVGADKLLNDFHGTSVSKMEAVVLGTRSPYSRFLSEFFFLRNSYASGSRASPKMEIAAACADPLEFARKFQPKSSISWFSLDRKNVLPNLRLVRFENIQSDFDAIAEEFGYPSTKMPHLNAGKVRSYDEYMCEELEELVYQQYRPFFELCNYDRMTGLPKVAVAASEGPITS